MDSGSSQALRYLNLSFSPNPVLAGLRSAGGSGNKFLDVRRLRSRLVSKNSADFAHRKLPEAKRREPDCGTPFLWLLSFGEAKESDSPPGDPGKPRDSKPLSMKKLLAHVAIGLAAKNIDKN